MKASELKKCAKCGKGLMHTGLPLFWKVSVERLGIKMDAVQRRAGLEMYFGGGRAGAALAGAMGTDEDIAVAVTAVKDIFLCEDCAMKTMHSGLFDLLEYEAAETLDTD